MKNYRKRMFMMMMVFILIAGLTGCSSQYKTKPDYTTTEQVTMNFMNAYIAGDLDKAMQNVAEEAVISTDSGQMKGKETIEEMLKINIEKENKMAIEEQRKIDNSTITLTVRNSIPLFQLAGVDVVKTKETFEVQDGQIVKWEIKHFKESVDLIEKVASGTTGLEAEVQDGIIVVTKVMEGTPAAGEGIQSGDIIESINGIGLQDMKYGDQEIPYRLIGEIGSEVELKIKRGTETRSVKLQRIDMNELS